MMLFHEIHQFLFWLFENLIIFIKLGLYFSLKVIFRTWMFRGDSKNFILNMFWQEQILSHVFFPLELYQLLFLFFKNLIIWRKLGLKFSLRLIFIIWMFIGDNKKFILNVLWWEHVLFHVLFTLELYHLFFLFFKTLIRWRNLGLGFSLKVISRRGISRGDSKHLILNLLWWEHVWCFF